MSKSYRGRSYPIKFTSKFWTSVSKSSFWTYWPYSTTSGLGTKILNGDLGALALVVLVWSAVGAFVIGGLLNAFLAIFVWSPNEMQVVQLWATVFILCWIMFATFWFRARKNLILIDDDRENTLERVAKNLHAIETSGLTSVNINGWWREAIDGDCTKIDDELKQLVSQLPKSNGSHSAQEISELADMLKTINEQKEQSLEEARKELESL